MSKIIIGWILHPFLTQEQRWIAWQNEVTRAFGGTDEDMDDLQLTGDEVFAAFMSVAIVVSLGLILL